MRRSFLSQSLALSGALALALQFPLALAQTPPDQVEITTWGTYEFALGNFSGTKKLSILAGRTLGSNGLTGIPGSIDVWEQGGESPLAFDKQLPQPPGGSSHMGRTYEVQSGKMYKGQVDYGPGGLRALHIRVRASQGTVFNNGQVVVTDASNYSSNSAQYVYGEVSAGGGIPTWRLLLGLAFWISGYSIPIAAALLGDQSGSGEFTVIFPEGTSSVTLYYKMTGCTAFQDYKNSFSVPVSQLQPGVAYGVDIYGWCGGGGVGNWAKAVQRALVPRPLDQGSSYMYSFSDPSVPGYVIYTAGDYAISGPDDCGGWYTDPYDHKNGIHFKISGEECWTTGFGLPGQTGRVLTSAPSLTLKVRPVWWVSGTTGEAKDYVTFSDVLLSRKPAGLFEGASVQATFTPRVFYYGIFGTGTASGTASSGGSTVSGTGTYATFAMTDGRYPDGDNVYDSSAPSLLTHTYSITFPAYTGTCTLKNSGTSTITIHELTPPGTFTARLENGSATYTFPKKTVAAGGTVNLGKNGVYYVSSGSKYDLSVTSGGCSIYNGYSSSEGSVAFKDNFFGLR